MPPTSGPERYVQPHGLTLALGSYHDGVGDWAVESESEAVNTFWVEGWRAQLCHCASCVALYRAHNIEYITEEEVDLPTQLEKEEEEEAQQQQQQQPPAATASSPSTQPKYVIGCASAIARMYDGWYGVLTWMVAVAVGWVRSAGCTIAVSRRCPRCRLRWPPLSLRSTAICTFARDGGGRGAYAGVWAVVLHCSATN